MKTLITLLFAAAALASCDQTEIPPTVSSQDDDVYYQFDGVLTDSTFAGLETTFDNQIIFDNPSFPDSAFTVRITKAGDYNSHNETLVFTVPVEGEFVFNINYDWFLGGRTDSIWGSGYFDADTAYIDYQYEGLTSGEYGSVHVHSL